MSIGPIDLRIDTSSYLFRAVVLATLVILAVSFSSAQNDPIGAPLADKSSASQTDKGEPPKSFSAKLLEDPTAFFTMALTLLTTILAGAAAGQIYFLRRADATTRMSADAALTAAEAAKRSAEVAEETLIASNRPWLQAKVSLDQQPVIFGENGVSTAVAIALQNVGTAPARHVEVDAWLLVYRTEPERNFIDEHLRRCKDVLQSAGIATLFPGETFPDAIGSQSFSIGTSLTSEEVQAGLAASHGGGVSLFIGGCATYLAPASPERTLMTSFLRRVDRLDLKPLHPSQGIIAADKISLTPFLFGAGNDAT